MNLQRSEHQNQIFLAQLESQQRELAEQRDRYNEMHAAVLSLQDQLTLVRHQSSQPVTPQNGTDTSELMGCLAELHKEMKQIREDNQRKSSLNAPSQFSVPPTFDIATPILVPNHGQMQAISPVVSPSQSAGAGYVPGFASPTRVQPAPRQPTGPPSSSSSSSSLLEKAKKGGTPGSTIEPPWPSSFGGGGGRDGVPSTHESSRSWVYVDQ